MGRMTLITGGERRRRWSEEDRVRILAAIAEPGAVVADVARREDICTSLVYKWRRAARRKGSADDLRIFAGGHRGRAGADDVAGPGCARRRVDVIEVELKDVRVRIGAGASSSVIAATLKALRR